MDKLIQDVDFGRHIRNMRQARRMKQQDVVDEMKKYGGTMSRDTYTKIELGDRNIFMSDLIRLKLVFGVEYADFFEDFEAALMKEPNV